MGSQVVKRVGSAALVKVLVMGFTGLIGLFNSRLIIGHFGVDAYALYGLLAALPLLIPFADLGMAAVVLNAVGESPDPKTDPTVRSTLTSVMRVLIVSGLIITLTAGLLTLLDWWPVILGTNQLDGSARIVAFVCFAIFGLSLPLSIAPRVLIGVGRTTTQILATAVTAPFIMASLGLLIWLAPGQAVGSFLAILSFAASALVLMVTGVLAARVISPQLIQAAADVPKLRRKPGVRARHIAGPMLFQSLVLPLAMQTDRLLLSHLTHGDELAQYNLANQLYGPFLQTIVAAGITLWPVYARARATGELLSPKRASLMFGAVAVAGALVMTALLGLLVPFITVGRFGLNAWLVAGFVAFVGVEALKYPLGMYLTDEAGLRAQILPIAILVPLNLALSWWWTQAIGAAGPILGSVVAVLACQVVPYAFLVRADLIRRAKEPKTIADTQVGSGQRSQGA